MENKTYKGFITELQPYQLFAYGSNHQEIPGAGAALFAQKWGARYGRCTGLQGQTWGIITTDLDGGERPNVPKTFIIEQIIELYQWAINNPRKEIFVAYCGQNGNTNLSGFTNEELALMFYNGGIIPSNIVFEEQFYNIIKSFGNVS